MDFATLLTNLMEKENTTAQELGQFVGVSRQSVQKWKDGAVPTVDKAVKIAEFYGMSIGEFLGTKVDNVEQFIRIPVLGDVSAGSFNMSTLLSGQYLTINNRLLDGYPREECFALHVSGESMQPEFLDRSFIIVHQQRQCRDGDYVIVLDEVTGDNTFKQYREYPDHIDLVPLNKDFQIISFRKQQINRLIIQGVVINKYEPSGKVKLTY